MQVNGYLWTCPKCGAANLDERSFDAHNLHCFPWNGVVKVANETYRCLYCQVSMNDSAEWIDHLNSEAHRHHLLNRHKVQRDPGDENPARAEPDND